MVRYGESMMSTVAAPIDLDSLESTLRGGLASADAASDSIVPILHHVLASEDNSLFGDEIIARIRGMLRHLARQLLSALHAGEGGDRPPPSLGDDDADRIAALSDVLLQSPEFARHLHALALEWQLTQRIDARFDVDPVLTPLLQSLIASSNAETAGLAMRFLAAQARHGQAQRRMSLPLSELPGDILHIALMAIEESREQLGETEERVQAAQARIRENYDESATRLGMAGKLISTLGVDALDALCIRHAGVAMFISALSLGAGLDRELAALATHESQAARLMLALRAAGLKADAVLDQCLTLHPDLLFPGGLEGIGVDRAAAILASGGSDFGN